LELVYLWVENYKNIHHQGFNFSPRFHCEYNDKTKELTINENDDYIPDFFGKNLNITAIVGKNGSGKSNVIKLLMDRLEVQNMEDVLYLEPDFDYLTIFYYDEKFMLLSNIDDISSTSSLNKIYQDGFYFENLKLSSFQAENPYFKIKNLYNKEELEDNIYNLTLDYNQIIKLLLTYNQEGLITFFIPKYVLLEELSQDKILLSLIKSMHEMNERKDLKVNAVKKAIEYFEYNYILTMRTRGDYNSYLEELFLLNELIYFEEKIEEQYFIEKVEKFSNGDWNRQDIIDIENLLKEFSVRTFSEYEQLCSNDDYILISEDLDINLLFKYMDLLEIRVLDINKIDFEMLSHGEKYLIGIFLNILESINIEKNNFIFLDEPDLSFHPKWQKEYIKFLVSLLKNFNNPINIIFTTHSPFLLSDMPKQNIIFLDKDENRNCQVLTNDEVLEKKQTFGANIHTLLSDSFFMEDGLMGEFAKGKITEIKKLYQLTQDKCIQKRLEKQKTKELAKIAFNRRKKRLWQIQKIIGEPFLQRVIKNYLDELEFLFSDDKTLIVKELAEIEERKKYLEALQKRKE